MCNRILLFSSNPGRVAAEIEVTFPHPRNRLDAAFRQLVDDIYAKMTARATAAAEPPQRLHLGSRLPPVSTNMMAGLMETVAGPPYDGTADLPKIARTLQLEVDELFPVAEILQYLGFAEIKEGDFMLSADARNSPSSTHSRARRFSPSTCSPRCRWHSTSGVCSTSAPAIARPACDLSRSWRIISATTPRRKPSMR